MTNAAGADRVRVVYRKWDGRQHWVCETIRTAVDEWGTWLYSPTGTELTRPGFSFRTEAPSITLVAPDWSSMPTFWATELGPGLRYEIYSDVITRPEWTAPDEVRAVDLDLDVVRLRDGGTRVLDEDEFAEHSVSLAYPDEIVVLARMSCDQLRDALDANAEPYARVGRRRLDEAITLLGV